MTGPPRIVIDANIFVSAFLFGGNPEEVVRFVRQEKVLLVHSSDTRTETERVLREKFQWRERRIRSTCDRFWRMSISIDPTAEIHACADPDDNRILECAMEGQAQFIVTGDKDLLRMGSYGACEILTARAFLDRIQSMSE